MKHLFTLLIAVSWINWAQGQKVGIGTLTPAKLLDVNGDVLLNGLTVGHGSGTSNATNTVTGVGALQNNTTGFNNVAVGHLAMANNTTGVSNVAVGTATLRNNSSGNYNSAFGDSAMVSNVGGSANTALGAYAMYFNGGGSNNTAIGANALLYNTSGISNTAVGAYSLQFCTANNNTAIGLNSLYFNTTGFSNTATGVGSLRGNTTGGFNTASGLRSMFTNTTGNYNTATGDSALFRNNTGSFNTAVGIYALMANITGTNNTALGLGADVSIDGLTNATAIGNGATVNSSNKIRLGNNSVTVIEGNVAFTTSDGRFKQNIRENVPGLELIKALRPVTYQYKSFELERFINQNNPQKLNTIKKSDYADAENMIHMGFIAQDLESLIKQKGYDLSVVHTPTNATDNYSIAYGELVMPLVKAIQEQQLMIEELKKRNELVEKELSILKNGIK